jgi:hypothetical protein
VWARRCHTVGPAEHVFAQDTATVRRREIGSCKTHAWLCDVAIEVMAIAATTCRQARSDCTHPLQVVVLCRTPSVPAKAATAAAVQRRARYPDVSYPVGE